MSDGRSRCAWVPAGDALYAAYHDEEWGVPLHDDRALFELLTLEGFQAGLSWSTILRKREPFRVAFDGFDIATVAAYGDADIARLLADPGIVRNRQKIAAAIGNARATLAVQDEFGALDRFLWQLAPPPGPRPTSAADVPVSTPASDALSKALRRRGFRFVGPTICYAFMQASGMVDDHTADCFRAARPAAP